MGRGRHPNSIANLKPWKPGRSGNPAGRPKRRSLAERAHAILDASRNATRDGAGADGLPWDAMYELTLVQLYDRAISGRIWACKAILDRVWPAPRCACCVRAFYEGEPIAASQLTGVAPEVSNPRPEPLAKPL